MRLLMKMLPVTILELYANQFMGHRNVTCDNRFTSIEIFDEMLKEY